LRRHAEPSGDVGRANRETVSHRPVEWGVVTISENVGAQHASGSFGERDEFDRGQKSRLADLAQDERTGLRKRQCGHVSQFTCEFVDNSPNGAHSGHSGRGTRSGDGGPGMTKRYWIAGLLGGFAMYVWMSVAHIATPLGE